MRNAQKQLQQKTSLSFVSLFFALGCALALAGCGGGGGGGGGAAAAVMPTPGGGDGSGGGMGGDTPSELVSQIFSRANHYSWSDGIFIASDLSGTTAVTGYPKGRGGGGGTGEPSEPIVATYNTEQLSGTNFTIGRKHERIAESSYLGYNFGSEDRNGWGIWGSYHFQHLSTSSGINTTPTGITVSIILGDAYSTGYLTGNNPARGSATWTGFTTVFDTNRPQNIGISTAQINVDFTDMTADAMFSNFEDTNLSPINFNNMAIQDGRFRYRRNSNSLNGAFYGPNQEEAGGTFSYYPEGINEDIVELIGDLFFVTDRVLIGGFSAERRQ